MSDLFDDFITGVIVIAIFGGIHGLTKGMAEKAAQAHKKGLMSYSTYTRMLTSK